jgi:hypothetical protein
MAIGAITYDGGDGMVGEKPSAPLFAVDVEFAGDAAYPAGGTPNFQGLVRDAIEAAVAALPDANVRGRTNIEIRAVAGYDAGQYVPWYDRAADKLFVRDGGSATWAEAAGNLSTTTFKLTLLCA